MKRIAALVCIALGAGAGVAQASVAGAGAARVAGASAAQVGGAGVAQVAGAGVAQASAAGAGAAQVAGAGVAQVGGASAAQATGAGVAQAASAGAAQAPVAHLSTGTISGIQESGVAAFLGVPFAAPPVGPDRWRAPRPVAAWQGTRDASHFAASCYQALTPEGFGPWKHEFVVQGEVSEDCLYLNVWTPKVDATARLPVLVWVHGGGFTQGSGSVAVYDGHSLAADGIVVVNFNYRMGAFGFFAHPELTREAGKEAPPGNYGLQDMVAALQWVRANIAALGGDPGKVTIAGQSAGAMAIHDLLVSPLAKGLFQRAIIESGLPNIAPPTSLAAAEQAGEDFAHAKNATSLAALRALPPADLLGPAKLPKQRFGPIVDGVLLPDAAAKLAADGKSQDMPVLIGMVADENSALSPSYATADEATRLQMRERGLAALYAWGSERVAHSRQPVFVYLFTHTEPGPDSARYRAFHSAELPYVFGTLDKSPERNFTDADRGLARTVSSYWANFVKTGDPNGKGLPSWPRFAPSGPQIMKLDVESAAQPLLPEQKLRAVRNDLAHGGNPSIF